MAVSGRPAGCVDRPVIDQRWSLVAAPGEVVLDRRRPHELGLRSVRPSVPRGWTADDKGAVGSSPIDRVPAASGAQNPDPAVTADRGRHRRLDQHAGRRGVDEPGRHRDADRRRRPRPADALPSRPVRDARRTWPRRCDHGGPAGRCRRAARRTYLETKATSTDVAQLYVPILLAFSVFALLAAAFTIANVVSGIVLTSYRDIGVMKAVGFTPGQVTPPSSDRSRSGHHRPSSVSSSAPSRSQPILAQTPRSFGLPGAFRSPRCWSARPSLCRGDRGRRRACPGDPAGG